MESLAKKSPLEAYLNESCDPAEREAAKKQIYQTITKVIGEDDQIISERIKTYFDYFAEEFSRADVLAGKYQTKFLRASVAIYVLSALAVMAISAQYIFHLPHFVGGIEIVAMVVILLILFRGNRVGWHRRWLDYRFLAERLRYGLNVAVLVEKGSSDAEKSLACRWVGSSWCLNYYQEMWQNRPRSNSLLKAGLDSLKDQLNTTWLNDQLGFHKSKHRKAALRHKWISTATELFFWLTLIAALLHITPAILHMFHLQIHLPYEDLLNSTLTYLAIVFPTIAAALTGLRSHFGYKKIADRSAMMVTNLLLLQQKLRECKSLAELQELALEAESLMVQENADWYVTVRLHELEAA